MSENKQNPGERLLDETEGLLTDVVGLVEDLSADVEVGRRNQELLSRAVELLGQIHEEQDEESKQRLVAELDFVRNQLRGAVTKEAPGASLGETAEGKGIEGTVEDELVDREREEEKTELKPREEEFAEQEPVREPEKKSLLDTMAEKLNNPDKVEGRRELKEFLEKLGGNKTYRFNERGEREYVKLRTRQTIKKQPGDTVLVFDVYRADGELIGQEKLPITAIRYREFNKVPAEKLPKEGGEGAYRTNFGVDIDQIVFSELDEKTYNVKSKTDLGTDGYDVKKESLRVSKDGRFVEACLPLNVKGKKEKAGRNKGGSEDESELDLNWLHLAQTEKKGSTEELENRTITEEPENDLLEAARQELEGKLEPTEWENAIQKAQEVADKGEYIDATAINNGNNRYFIKKNGEWKEVDENNQWDYAKEYYSKRHDAKGSECFFVNRDDGERKFYVKKNNRWIETTEEEYDTFLEHEKKGEKYFEQACPVCGERVLPNSKRVICPICGSEFTADTPKEAKEDEIKLEEGQEESVNSGSTSEGLQEDGSGGVSEDDQDTNETAAVLEDRKTLWGEAISNATEYVKKYWSWNPLNWLRSDSDPYWKRREAEFEKRQRMKEEKKKESEETENNSEDKEDFEFEQECPSCGIMVSANSGMIGKKVDCPRCKYRFITQKPEEKEDDIEKDDQKDIERYITDLQNLVLGYMREFTGNKEAADYFREAWEGDPDHEPIKDYTVDFVREILQEKESTPQDRYKYWKNEYEKEIETRGWRKI